MVLYIKNRKKEKSLLYLTLRLLIIYTNSFLLLCELIGSAGVSIQN